MRLSHTLSHHEGSPCPYCTRRMGFDNPQLMPTRDHYPIPKSRGGRITIICCYACNHMKGDMAANEWAAFIAENKGGWFARRPPEMELPVAVDRSRPPSKPIPIDESKMILIHGKKAWKSYRETGIKPARLVCPVITMTREFFLREQYPRAYRIAPETACRT